MNHCSVVSCLNKRRDKTYTFFTFPSNPDICSQWVEFCHSTELTERLLNSGPYGLSKFVICSEHFDPHIVVVNRKIRVDTVPNRIGKTHMTEKMLLEIGFNPEQCQTANQKRSQDKRPFIDAVLVEMLDPDDLDQEATNEDSNFEFVRMKSDDQQFEFEDGFKQEFVESDEEMIEVQPVSNGVEVQTQAVEAVKKGCKNCSNFKLRYENQVAQNKHLEDLIKQNKKNIVESTTTLQKLHDRLTLRRMKRNKLKKMYQELKKRLEREPPELEIEETKPPESEEGDASDDETTDPWW